MESPFIEIEEKLRMMDLEREVQQLNDRIVLLQKMNGGLRGANRRLKDRIKELQRD